MMLKSRCWYIPVWRLEGRIHFLVCSAFRGHLHSWTHGPFPPPQPARVDQGLKAPSSACLSSAISLLQVNSGLEITYKFSLKFWVMTQRKLELYPKTKYLEQQNHCNPIPTPKIISPRAQTQSLKHHSQFLGSQSTLGNKRTFCVTSQSWSYAPEIWWEVSFSHFNSIFSQKFTEIGFQDFSCSLACNETDYFSLVNV